MFISPSNEKLAWAGAPGNISSAGSGRMEGATYYTSIETCEVEQRRYHVAYASQEDGPIKRYHRVPPFLLSLLRGAESAALRGGQRLAITADLFLARVPTLTDVSSGIDVNWCK